MIAKPSLWALHRQMRSQVTAACLSLLSDPQLRQQTQVQLDDFEPPKMSYFEVARGGSKAGGKQVAVIPLQGIITPKSSLLSIIFGFGGGGLMSFRENLRDAMGDRDVGAILLDVDSPGGIVDLVPETADELRAAREEKPIVAVANTMSASAAYWLATQASELVVTPSGEVGSVGVYQLHEDWSGFNENMGVDPTYIFAGEHKTEGNPDEPLGEDAKRYMQGQIDDLYGMFVDAVAAGRKTTSSKVESDFGQGRMLLAKDAVAAGMADSVATLEDTLNRMVAGDLPGSGIGASAAGGKKVTKLEVPKAEEPEEEPEEDPDDDELSAVEDEPEDEPETEDDDGDEPEESESEARARVADLLFS